MHLTSKVSFCFFCQYCNCAYIWAQIDYLILLLGKVFRSFGSSLTDYVLLFFIFVVFVFCLFLRQIFKKSDLKIIFWHASFQVIWIFFLFFFFPFIKHLSKRLYIEQSSGLHFACTQEIQLSKMICIKATEINSVVSSSLTVKMRSNSKFPGLDGTFLSKKISSHSF